MASAGRTVSPAVVACTLLGAVVATAAPARAQARGGDDELVALIDRLGAEPSVATRAARELVDRWPFDLDRALQTLERVRGRARLDRFTLMVLRPLGVRVVPALAKALADRAPFPTSPNVLLYLVLDGLEPATREALLWALLEDPRIRAALDRELPEGERGLPHGLDVSTPLVELLVSDPSPRIRRSAAELLRRSSEFDAANLERLRAVAATDPDPGVRRAVIRVLGECPLGALDQQRLVLELASLLRARTDPLERCALLLAISGRCGARPGDTPQPAVAAILDATRDPSPRVRAVAWHVFTSGGGDLERLGSAGLGDEAPEVRAGVARALGVGGQDPEACARLLGRAADDPDPAVAAACERRLEALARFSGPRVSPETRWWILLELLRWRLLAWLALLVVATWGGRRVVRALESRDRPHHARAAHVFAGLVGASGSLLVASFVDARPWLETFLPPLPLVVVPPTRAVVYSLTGLAFLVPLAWIALGDRGEDEDPADPDPVPTPGPACAPVTGG